MNWTRGWRVVAVGLVAIAAGLLLEDSGARQLNRLLLYLPGVDKVLHFLQWGIIARVLYALLGRTTLSPARRTATALVLGATVAVLDEVQQSVAPGRSVEMADIGASAAGLLMAAASIVVRTSRTRAAILALVAVATGSALTYDSYARTHDFNRGLRLEADGRFDEARAAYLRALDAGVHSASLYNGLAWTSVESDTTDPAAAVAWAEQSLRLEPGHADALDTYGWALHHAGRDREAVVPLRQAFALNPDIFCIHYHLGATYAALGDPVTAAHHLREQIARFPRTSEAARAAALLAGLDALPDRRP